jgi:hypothetical protein
MMKTTHSSTTVNQDAHLLGRTIFRLALPRIITRIAVLIAIVLCCYWGMRLVYSTGMSLNYKSFKGLEAFGPQLTELLTGINKYIWIAVNVILALIVLALTRRWFVQSMVRGKAALIPIDVFRDLCASLSPQVLEVLRWVWKDPHAPVNIGMLQTTLKQILTGRVAKMALAQEQSEELNQAIQQPQRPSVPHKDSSGFREPTLMA